MSTRRNGRSHDKNPMISAFTTSGCSACALPELISAHESSAGGSAGHELAAGRERRVPRQPRQHLVELQHPQRVFVHASIVAGARRAAARSGDLQVATCSAFGAPCSDQDRPASITRPVPLALSWKGSGVRVELPNA